MRDEAARRRQDMRCRAVILLELDDRRPGEITVEAQDVRHLGTTPRIDRLIVVADAADILPLLREQPQPEILGTVGILIFVDHHIAEAVLIVGEHVAVGLQDHQHVEQQIAEIAGIHRAQAILILLVEFPATTVGELLPLARIDIGGSQAPVLPAIDQPGELARRPALLVEIGGGKQLLEQAKLIVGVENGEARRQPDQFGVAAQHPRGDRMESAEPGHPLDRLTE